MPGLINDLDVERLDNQALPRVLNALIIADADEHRVPLDRLDLTCRVNDPDGGIDSRINWPEVPHDFFSEGLNVAQYKAGALTPLGLEKEFKKKGVQRALRNRGRYLIFVGKAHADLQRNKLRAKLKSMCKTKRISPSRCKIVFGDQIAHWVNLVPAVAIRPEFGKPYPAFQTIDVWSNQQQMRNAFHRDESRGEIIQRIESFIRDGSPGNMLRIEGPAGVGKTRTVLQALKKDCIRDRTIYCPLADDAQSLMAALQGQNANVIIVLDECEYKRQTAFRPYAEGAGSEVRVVCIGPTEYIDALPSGLEHILQIGPLPNDDIKAIVTSAYASAPIEAVETVVRLASGYVKLAMFIAGELATRPDVPPHELRKIRSIQDFLERFLEVTTKKTLQALSLLARVGWEESLADEARALAKVLNLPFPQMQDAVARLKDKGVVLPRGRYLYVSPDLLAISAAADLWDARGPDLITIVSDLPGPGPKRQLLIRLAMMSGHLHVQKGMERLLGDEGLYKALEDLDRSFPSEIFRLLSAGLPETAIATLERLIGPASREELLDFSDGRREVMWALESLLRWPETSLRAARIVRKLALAENERIANNATGIFETYFHVYLSGSPVPLKERLDLVWELARSSDSVERTLAIKGAGGALELREHRTGGETDYLSKRTFPKEWRPTTYGELWEARLIAVRQLEFLAELDDQVALDARRELLLSVSLLVREGQRGEALRILKHFSPRGDDERRLVLEVSQRISQDGAEVLTDEEKRDLNTVVERAFGTAYFERLRRWVGKRIHSDYDPESPNDPYKKAEEFEKRLAEEGYGKGLTEDEIKWLVSSEAENIWIFGRILGRLDIAKTYLPTIIALSPTNLNCMLLSSYLIGLEEREGSDARDQILDELAETDPTLSFVATWRGTSTTASGHRIIRLMKEGRVDRHLYRALMYGGWVGSLPPEISREIIQYMLKADDGQLIEPVLSLLRYGRRDDQEAFGVNSDLVWEALERTPIEATSYVEWLWGDLARRAVEHDPVRLAKLVLHRVNTGKGAYLSNDPAIAALTEATKRDPTGVFAEVGAELLKNDSSAFQLLLALQKWYGELLPAKLLVDWANENRPRGPKLAAELVIIAAPLPERARLLAANFPEDPDILLVFASNLETGGWMGPTSERYKGLLKTAEEWRTDQDARIRHWASQLVANLKERIKQWEVLEAEEEL